MPNHFFILMGVAGSGKSSVGAAVAERLGWTLIEADDHHSVDNKQKMLAGRPLDDDDRASWLDALVRELRHQLGQGRSAVLLCSALRQRYRDVFRAAYPQAPFVYLHLSELDAHARVQARSATHDFPASLVASQFAALESPEAEDRVFTVDASLPFDVVCSAIAAWAATGALAVTEAVPRARFDPAALATPS